MLYQQQKQTYSMKPDTGIDRQVVVAISNGQTCDRVKKLQTCHLQRM